MNTAHIMLFDLTNHAHFSMFVRCWLQTWNAIAYPASLTFVVTPYFMRTQRDLIALAEHAPNQSVRFVTPTQDEMKLLRAVEGDAARQKASFADVLREGSASAYGGVALWKLFTDYAERLNADLSVMCHIDHHLPVMMADVPSPRALAGIYFAPSFHYEALLGATYEPDMEARAAALRQKLVIARALQHSSLKRLFFVDPYVINFCKGFPNAHRIAYLTEPFVHTPSTDSQVRALRRSLGVEAGRRTLLIAGHLTPRKGVEILIEACDQLPRQTQHKVCLLLTGTIDATYQQRIDPLLDNLTRNGIQVIRRYEFIPDALFSTYFELADVVVALYRQHAGTSNICLLAAAAQRPLLCADYGAMGRTVRDYGLGLTVTVDNPTAVGDALMCLLTSAESPVDAARRLAYVRDHQPETFAQTFFDSLLTALSESRFQSAE